MDINHNSRNDNKKNEHKISNSNKTNPQNKSKKMLASNISQTALELKLWIDVRIYCTEISGTLCLVTLLLRLEMNVIYNIRKIYSLHIYMHRFKE